MDKEKKVGIGESETPVNTGLTAYDVLYLAHRAIGNAFGDWLGADPKNANADLWYLWGIHDMTSVILTELEVRDVGIG